MMYVYEFLALLFFSTVRSDDDCSSDKSQLAAVRLRKNLLCEYDTNSRPIRDHGKPINVSVQSRLIYYDYNMQYNSFTIDSWMTLEWIDEHLQWNPDDYESIKSIHLSYSDIWTPDLSIYNNRNQGGDQKVVQSTSCTIENNGQVFCVPSTSHSTMCISDLTKFPFDTHNCTVRLGSWVHTGEELNFLIPKEPISTANLVPNGEWKLVGTNAYKHPGVHPRHPNNTYPSINWSFKIQRLSGGHVASVIFPAVVLTIITLTSLWLAPDNPRRLGLCYVNVISEFLYLQYIYWVAPTATTGYRMPLILIFARDSLVLSAFTLLLTVALAKMIKNEKPVPEWISNLVCVLVAFRPGEFVFLGNFSLQGSEQNEDDIASFEDYTSPKKQWLMFAKILDRLSFGIFLIVGSCMIVAFTP